jgi:hypothetical protein
VKTGPEHEITEQEGGVYYKEFSPMVVADAECEVCGAKYLAWVDERGREPWVGNGTIYHFKNYADPDHYDDPRRAFFDLSYRKAFNDEPAKADEGDPDLKSLGVGGYIARLRKQRDELLAALEAARKDLAVIEKETRAECALEHAKAALEAAKEQQ